MPKARVGLVGAGYVCTRHLLALKDLPSVEVVGVCDTDQAKAQTLAQKFGIAAFPSLAAMAAAQPQIIHVLTPPASHCALTLEAIAMGCHVFVEKPMAESAEECDRMIAAARAQGVQAFGQSLRPVRSSGPARDSAGAVGSLRRHHRGARHPQSDYPPYAGGPLPAPYRQGSYPFRDLGVHGVYVLESFLGPVRNLAVRYYETGRDPMLTFDEWRVYAECERGTGYLYLSWNSRPAQGESVHSWDPRRHSRRPLPANLRDLAPATGPQATRDSDWGFPECRPPLLSRAFNAGRVHDRFDQTVAWNLSRGAGLSSGAPSGSSAASLARRRPSRGRSGRCRCGETRP